MDDTFTFETTEKDPMPTTAARNDMAKLAELVQDIRVAMLTTFPTGEEHPDTRPMYTQKVEPDSFDGVLWFLTDAGSTKIRELRENSRVLITYAAPEKNRYVAVYGAAEIHSDPNKVKELWNLHARGWWPNGPEDPSILLVRVVVDGGKYWDGPSTTSYLLSLIKAVATGERIDSHGDSGTFTEGTATPARHDGDRELRID